MLSASGIDEMVKNVGMAENKCNFLLHNVPGRYSLDCRIRKKQRVERRKKTGAEEGTKEGRGGYNVIKGKQR
jgi:hypothetical protein